MKALSVDLRQVHSFTLFQYFFTLYFIHTLILFTLLGIVSSILNSWPSNVAIIGVTFIFEKSNTALCVCLIYINYIMLNLSPIRILIHSNMLVKSMLLYVHPINYFIIPPNITLQAYCNCFSDKNIFCNQFLSKFSYVCLIGKRNKLEKYIFNIHNLQENHTYNGQEISTSHGNSQVK